MPKVDENEISSSHFWSFCSTNTNIKIIEKVNVNSFPSYISFNILMGESYPGNAQRKLQNIALEINY